jgi:hypothetical protein
MIFVIHDQLNKQEYQFTSYKNINSVHFDKSYVYISRAKLDNYPHTILNWNIQNDIITGKTLSALEYIKFGKLLASVLQEELAFHCFYLAHLKDPEAFKTNSDIQFDTYNSNILI